MLTYRCDDVALQYGYTVAYDGVGDPTPGNEHVGSCTQIAKFIRTAEHKTVCEDTNTPYTLVSLTLYFSVPLGTEKNVT